MTRPRGPVALLVKRKIVPLLLAYAVLAGQPAISKADVRQELLRLINRLSPQAADGYVHLQTIKEEEAAHELGWPNARGKVHGWTKTLVEAGFLRRLGFGLIASYKGLVWETQTGRPRASTTSKSWNWTTRIRKPSSSRISSAWQTRSPAAGAG